MHLVRLLAVALLLFPLVGTVPADAVAAGPAGAAAPAEPAPLLGIQLLDAPVSEKNDPRARIYIIDQLSPGDIITRHLRVSNKSPKTEAISLYSAAASIGGGSFQPAIGSTGNDLSSWISLSSSQVTLAPRKTEDLTVRIDVPRDTSGGERYAVIWAQESSAPSSGTVAEVNRVGIRVYLDISGATETTDFTIGSVTASRDAGGVPHLSAQVRNTGQRAVDVSGTVGLSDGPGGTSVTPVATDRVVTIAPGGTEPVGASFSPLLADGPWQATISLTSGVTKRESIATIRFPSVGAPASTVAPVAVTPPARGSSAALWWWILVGVALALIVAAAIWWWIRRRRPSRR